jgi:hypothetical protein
MAEREEAIRGLRAYRKTIAAELKRVDASIAALTGPDVSEQPSRSRPTGNVNSRLPTDRDRVLESVMSDGAEWTAPNLAAAMLDRGWSTQAADPANSLRAALSQLHQDGVVERVGRGTYRWLGAGSLSEAPADDILDVASTDEPSATTRSPES